MKAMKTATGSRVHAVQEDAARSGEVWLAVCGARCTRAAQSWPPDCYRCKAGLAREARERPGRSRAQTLADHLAPSRELSQRALGNAVLEVCPDCTPERIRKALRLLELVERAIKTDGEVGFDLPITGRYQVHIGVRDGACKGATLAEAVEAALEELDHE